MKDIYLLPLGGVSTKILWEISSWLERQFGLPCKIAEGIRLPDGVYSPIRSQYCSSLILQKLREMKPQDALRVLAVANVDLYVPQLNFVFGEADLTSGVAVISLCRLRQEFYGLEPDEALFTDRARKEAVHELGHTFGLTHCHNPNCVMHFSNSLSDTDRKGRRFCTMCEEQLRENLRKVMADEEQGAF